MRTNPPTDSDFRTHHELGRLPKAPPCLRAGLSTFRTVDDAERMALLFPMLGPGRAEIEVLAVEPVG